MEANERTIARPQLYDAAAPIFPLPATSIPAMSLQNDERYNWRETYFVLIDPARRPSLADVMRDLEEHAGIFRILEKVKNQDGLFRSLAIASYEDHSALEISYIEGDAVQAEINALAQTLQKNASHRERERLEAAKSYRAKFDIRHFEQTADTGMFGNVVKLPDITFVRQSKLKNGEGKHFHFDPNSYNNCRNDAAGAEFDKQDAETDGSSIIERIDPNTLILVLEVLCRQTGGIAVDPAAGVIC